MEYNVEPNKRKPMILVLLLCALGLALGLTPAFVEKYPSWYFQLPAALVFLACVLILSRFVLTTYTYQLYDASNAMSSYPKLNIYRIRKASSRMAYCIPFNNIVSIKKTGKIVRLPIPRENLCASMGPQNVYCVTYISERKEAVFLECSDEFAREIEKRIEVYSEVRDEAVEP